MVTSDAATVAGADDPAWFRLGRIEVGYQADLFLAPKRDRDPHLSLLKTYPRDVRLVFIDGKPLYGDARDMDELVNPEELDHVAVDHRKKSVDLIEPGYELGDQHYKELLGLFHDMLTWDIAPLIENEPPPGRLRKVPRIDSRRGPVMVPGTWYLPGVPIR